MSLSPEEKGRVVKLLREYLDASENGKSLVQIRAAEDHRRAELENSEVKPLVESYLNGRTPLADFKSTHNGIHVRHPMWGFLAWHGQVFFNMVEKVAKKAHQAAECDREIKAAIVVPADENAARNQIRTFARFVCRLGEAHVQAGGSKPESPREGSVPFFQSYFWNIQDPTWPIYYTNDVKMTADLNLWQPTNDHAENYIAFKHVFEKLATLFTDEAGMAFDFRGVSSVFWLKGGNPLDS